MPSIDTIATAFAHLYSGLQQPRLTKAKKMSGWNEQQLLPLVRFYLYGRFGSILQPEYPISTWSNKSTKGRLDFLIGKIAVEFAVRNNGKGRGNVSPGLNRPEVRKLSYYPGKSVLVLFDFSGSPYTRRDLNSFRRMKPFLNALGEPSAFNVLYYNTQAATDKPYFKLNVRPAATSDG